MFMYGVRIGSRVLRWSFIMCTVEGQGAARGKAPGSCAVSGGGLCTYIGHNYVQMGMSPLRHMSHVTSHVINYARRIDMNHHAEHPSTAHNEHSTSQHSKRGVTTSSAPENEHARHSTTSLTATQRLNNERQVVRRIRCR